MILGLVPVFAPNNPVELDTLLSKTFRVILSTCTVQPVLKFVPLTPLLPLVQDNIGVAGILDAVQVEAVTALLVRHILSPDPWALAVITSPFTTVTAFSVQFEPELTPLTVPASTPFLYTDIVAVLTAPVNADLVHVPLIFTVPVPMGLFTPGAAVHIAVGQDGVVVNTVHEGCALMKSSYVLPDTP